jgi:hypothetical protein
MTWQMLPENYPGWASPISVQVVMIRMDTLSDAPSSTCGAALTTMGLMLCTGCDRSDPQTAFDYRVIAGIKARCIGMNTCEVKLSDYTDFKRDTLYVFPEGSSQADIERILGRPLPDYEELSIHEVFMAKGNIAQHEQKSPPLERPPKGGLAFPFPRGVEPVRYVSQQRVRATVEHDRYTYFLLGAD